MRRLLTILLLAPAAAVPAVVVPASAAHADPAGTGYTLAFEDQFNGSALDTAKWNYRTDSKAYSTQRPQNVSVGGGALSIALKKETYGGKDYTGGGVVSKQTLRYGYYETRAKLNDGAGWHSSFWLMAGDGSTTYPASQRTEIDGFEIDSISPTRIHHGVLTWKGNGVSAGKSYGTTYTSTTVDSRDWHVYGIDWSETSTKFYVDGVLKYTAPYLPTDWTHDYTSIWLTSIAYGSVPDATKLPSSVQFDYVRYWQKDYYVDDDGPAAYGYSETGTWSTSTLTGWTVGSPTRYAACNTGGNTATWRPNLRAAGSYRVSYYRVTATNSDPAAKLTVAGTQTTVNGTAGPSGWVDLGTFALPAGTGTAVTLTGSGSGCARADAVRFTRV